MMDFAPATAPNDTERQRAELALRAAAPLKGNRNGKTCAQHDASDLDLFKAANEPSLFDAPPTIAPTIAPKKVAELPRNLTAQLLSEPFQLELDRISAAVAVEIAAGRDYWVKWGEGRFGKAPYWTLQLIQQDGEVFAREEMELHCRGSFGCWRSYGQNTVEAVKLERLRAIVRYAAKEAATDHEPTVAKQCRKLVSWIIEGFPPLLSGIDFAAIFDSDFATYEARERLRCAAIRAGAEEYVTEDGRTLSIYSL